MRPDGPKQVVEWARRHLGLEREFVVARAVELEPDQELRRSPVQIQALWQALVAHATGTAPAPGPPVPQASVSAVEAGSSEARASVAVASGPAEPAAATPDEEPDPLPDQADAAENFDLAELHDLVEAPSHAHDIEEKIKATFPGTELTLLPEPDGDNAGGET
ncbi:MAG: hypothetical protein F4110_05385 [Acidimicrobiaceae bacterium]|nr:hypothetical protein [Acidimicrobiaceae bacterium]MXZ98934.1 hypothetical protein [Acidimicrobiaceae bacterium]MYI53402.1 hypothetical protein [Acidimicrobiaceae bacterium]MYJ81558.1 hypothetical protein [Acidimicrobiaceae bacterium]